MLPIIAVTMIFVVVVVVLSLYGARGNEQNRTCFHLRLFLHTFKVNIHILLFHFPSYRSSVKNRKHSVAENLFWHQAWNNLL